MDSRATVIVERDASGAACRAATLVASAVSGALGRSGIAHLALSGGRTPGAMFEALGPRLPDWRHVHIWFTDERCVPSDDPRSNAREAMQHLAAPGAIWHPITCDLDAWAAAQRYERELAGVVLDVAVLGLGEDGHTASLFPGRPELSAAGRVSPCHNSPKPPPERVTLTLRCLNAARARVLLVAGPAKAAALAATVAGPSRQTPASLLDRRQMTVVCDELAAGASRSSASDASDEGLSPPTEPN